MAESTQKRKALAVSDEDVPIVSPTSKKAKTTDAESPATPNVEPAKEFKYSNAESVITP